MSKQGSTQLLGRRIFLNRRRICVNSLTVCEYSWDTKKRSSRTSHKSGQNCSRYVTKVVAKGTEDRMVNERLCGTEVLKPGSRPRVILQSALLCLYDNRMPFKSDYCEPMISFRRIWISLYELGCLQSCDLSYRSIVGPGDSSCRSGGSRIRTLGPP